MNDETKKQRRKSLSIPIPNENIDKQVKEKLEALQPKTLSLSDLVLRYQTSIERARGNGVDWKEITKTISDVMSLDINEDSLQRTYQAIRKMQLKEGE